MWGLHFSRGLASKKKKVLDLTLKREAPIPFCLSPNENRALFRLISSKLILHEGFISAVPALTKSVLLRYYHDVSNICLFVYLYNVI